MLEENYNLALKKIIKFTKSKSVDLAKAIGYDVSYISKWKSGSKLPSSRSVQTINSALGAYFAKRLEEIDKADDYRQTFTTGDNDGTTAFSITEYLNRAYRHSLQRQPRTKKANTSTASISIGHRDVTTFLNTALQACLQETTEPQELIVYGEFCTLYDAGFWELLCGLPNTQKLTIRVGLDLDKLEKSPAYITALYEILNRCLYADFYFYDVTDSTDTRLILLKNRLAVQYDFGKKGEFIMATSVEDPLLVQDILDKLSAFMPRVRELMASAPAPWITDIGYRTSFYAARKFFFFLTNGIEYLLPHDVFHRISAQIGAPENTYIDQLQITWEELLCRADLDVVIPFNSLIRYLEEGHIDLTTVQYTMTEDERRGHIEAIMHYLKENDSMSIGIVTLSEETTAYKNANLSFYSNCDTAFFKKNPRLIRNDAKPFYMIKSRRLQQLFLNSFKSLKSSNHYHTCSGNDVTRMYHLYKPIIEKIITTK